MVKRIEQKKIEYIKNIIYNNVIGDLDLIYMHMF